MKILYKSRSLRSRIFRNDVQKPIEDDVLPQWIVEREREAVLLVSRQVRGFFRKGLEI